jgi:hypothetical protein
MRDERVKVTSVVVDHPPGARTLTSATDCKQATYKPSLLFCPVALLRSQLLSI